MKIFKLLSDKLGGGGGRVVGFYVGEKTDEALTLLAISKRMSKSSLLRELVIPLVSNQDDLFLQVAKRAFLTWEYQEGTKEQVPLVEFKTDLQYDLQFRGISKINIDKIITIFNGILKATKAL